MSDPIKHECGIALIRLLKPLEHYRVKYGSWMYGLNKLYLLMEKQHNRGQDGAGVANLKLNLSPGKPYIFRHRSNEREPIRKVFEEINKEYDWILDQPEQFKDPKFAYDNLPFSGELLLGHLRYGTFGRNNINSVHPVIRANNWKSRSLVLAGNFNLTNVDELYNDLLDIGQHPIDYNDTVTMLENIGHFLDDEVEKQYYDLKSRGYSKAEVSPIIAERLDLAGILKESSDKWDGGYAIAGMIGHGDAFVLRDPNGIRPAFWYQDDEIVVVASERPVIQTAFNVPAEKIAEVQAGHAVIIKKNGNVSMTPIRQGEKKMACSFERIYFSRGSDQDIYRERKRLGSLLVPQILESIDQDLEHSVFSFIPNTAETAFYGMTEELGHHLNQVKKEELLKKCDPDRVEEILSKQLRVEKIAIKDVKLRTFITQDQDRDDLVTHVYDITYGTVKKDEDNLVIIDDSIVRGTTLKKSIIRILDRLGPKRIVIVSSSPQIRFPDCYGIDMSVLGDFIAFKAAIELLKITGQEQVINQVYNKCKAQQKFPKEEIINYVKDIYAPFSDQDVSDHIAKMLKTQGVNAEIKVVYQSVESLHLACPDHSGDWYFTGDYPTPGGNAVVNKAFINYIEGRHERGY
ncbi:MAG: amidophosphoribosyltransferase [Bacteroidetes bacterium]|jgi:amidophosphoribosyltransferase|nr:amidophosphoribosyltransferase [Bacteroidota bacterium]MBT3747961.1 amidophosphoribosyltransferase [Bacteroidota bacterium]MBT4409199.1 amidophosphoribosyltransferase [Bacteroidota bacterium]MBT7091892.1 amidophosphoribosyltransferase [Bacteroidota bacterium]MBT7464486.1 amidophosphoribosyltransferase [Bacteroidota bacterium]